jgi:carboxymethylenebutenolidase
MHRPLFASAAIALALLTSRVSVRSMIMVVAFGVALAIQAAVAGTDSSSVLTTQPAVSQAAPPAGAEDLAVDWISITVPEVGMFRAAIARPQGEGPFPVAIVLHGTHGFAREYVELAKDMAKHGVLTVATCWFSGGSGKGSRFIHSIQCPGAPEMPAAASDQTLRTLAAIIDAMHALPDVRVDRVALVGHSRGAGASLNYVLRRKNIQAVVLNSAGYPDALPAENASAPILILHGMADGPADGGSEFTSVERARGFEAALKRAGKPVEAVYYDSGKHNGIFTNAGQREDELRHIIDFLDRYLRD